MTSPILLLAGRFLLASALLMALYWVVWRKRATYRAKRMYLLTMPAVALAIALLQVEVYKPEPVVVERTTPNSAPSPIPSQGRGVDTAPITNLSIEKVEDSSIPSAPITNQSIEEETNSAALSEGQSISLPPLGKGKGWSLQKWGPLLYSLIVLALCIPFVANGVMLYRLRKRVSEERDETNDIRILTGEAVKAPFSFHRRIYLPLCLTEAQRRMILSHERAHILYRHYVDVWVAEAITRLLWFNPFLWWARQELRNVHEFEADSKVLASGEEVYAYQAILIEEVLHGDVVIANGFNHSFIRRRFIEMLQSSNHRMTSLGKAGTTAWMMLVIALMCCTVGEAETVYVEREQSPLPSLPQVERADSPEPLITMYTKGTEDTSDEGSDITLPSPAGGEKEASATPADSGQWVQAVAVEPQEQLKQVLFRLGEEHVMMLGQLFRSMNSIGEITTEQYEALKEAYPTGTLPSLDSINSNVREIKKALNTLMMEGMTGMQLGLQKRMTEMLQERGLDTLTLNPGKKETPARAAFSRKGDAQGPHYRMSEYKELAKADPTAKEQYETLAHCILRTQDYRQMTLAESKLTHVEAEQRIKEFTQSTFGEAGITLEINGSYRLPDGTLVTEDGEGESLPNDMPKVTAVKAHMQNGHLPTAPFTFSEYQQLTPKFQLVRHAQETHLICYECPQRDKEIISLHRELYLTDTDTGDKYMLRRIEGIDNDVWSMELNNYRDVPLQVTYVFPPLGPKVKEVTVNFPHKSNEKYRVRSIEAAQVKVVRDNSLRAACINPVEGDGKPENSVPTLKRDKSPNYDVQNEHTFPVYTDVYTTRQQVFHHEKDHYRIYRGKGCTYVTATYKVRWDWEFFSFSDDMMLVDPATGTRYMIAGIEHFPLDTHFWLNGQLGEYIRFVLVFPELPKQVTTVDLFEGGMQRRNNTDGADRYRGLTVNDGYSSPEKEKQGRVIY